MKKQQNGFADLFNWAEQQDGYWIEGIKIKFAEEMLSRMDALNISRKKLADLLGTSPAYVTKILRGSTNFTLESMVRIAQALNCELCTHLKEKDKIAVWVEYKPTFRGVESVHYLPGNVPQNTVSVSEISKEIPEYGVA